MIMQVIYPHVVASKEPRPMTAQQIWSVADQVRRQLTPRPNLPRLDLERVVRRAVGMKVNGTDIAVHWDLGRTVRDGQGREALGVTEADPALPGAVLVSLNADLIADREYLKRSTLAHEFGHAVFDGPSMVNQARKPAFAMVTPDEAHLETARLGRSGIDWREFRANEFMGALLVPCVLLQRELVRRAVAFGLALRDIGGGLPVLRKTCDPHRIEGLLIDLGERFGVSATFMEYRLHRYSLIQ
jgi:hypothetical protein